MLIWLASPELLAILRQHTDCEWMPKEYLKEQEEIAQGVKRREEQALLEAKKLTPAQEAENRYQDEMKKILEKLKE
jgi:hypothetical protein